MKDYFLYPVDEELLSILASPENMMLNPIDEYDDILDFLEELDECEKRIVGDNELFIYDKRRKSYITPFHISITNLMKRLEYEIDNAEFVWPNEMVEVYESEENECVVMYKILPMKFNMEFLGPKNPFRKNMEVSLAILCMYPAIEVFENDDSESIYMDNLVKDSSTKILKILKNIFYKGGKPTYFA